MHEAPPAHETVARILAVDEPVDARQIGFPVGAADLDRGGVLARIGARDLQPLGRARMRGLKKGGLLAAFFIDRGSDHWLSK